MAKHGGDEGGLDRPSAWHSAIAGAIGAGGLGYLAVNYGYEQFDNQVMISCIVLLVVLVQAVQFSGDRLVRSLIH